MKILQPGPGVGGHCIAVDPWFIVDSTPKEARMIRTAREVNDGKPHRVIDQVKAALKKTRSRTVACLGLAFKADIDDLRESPAVEIVRELAKDKKLKLLAVEPNVKALPASLAGLPNLHLAELDEAVKKSQVVLLLVNHRSFYEMDRQKLKGKTVLDTRGVWR